MLMRCYKAFGVTVYLQLKATLRVLRSTLTKIKSLSIRQTLGHTVTQRLYFLYSTGFDTCIEVV
jgi:hypothetical protein